MKIQAVDIEELKCDPANVRAHPTRNLDAIKASLTRFGQQKPIVVDQDGVVVAGNGTLEAARELGLGKLNIVRTKLKGSDRTAYAIADNRSGELAEWSEDLGQLLKSLQDDDAIDHLSTGFTDEEIEGITGMFDVDEQGLPILPDGDRAGFQQMTFTLSDEQVDTVKAAVQKAKQAGPFVDAANENSNGNALARIGEVYLG